MITWEEELLIEKMWEEGRTVVDIAKELGCSRNAVYNELNCGWIEGETTYHGRPKWSALKARRYHEAQKRWRPLGRPANGTRGRRKKAETIEYPEIKEEHNPSAATDEQIKYECAGE